MDRRSFLGALMAGTLAAAVLPRTGKFPRVAMDHVIGAIIPIEPGKVQFWPGDVITIEGMTDSKGRLLHFVVTECSPAGSIDLTLYPAIRPEPGRYANCFHGPVRGAQIKPLFA